MTKRRKTPAPARTFEVRQAFPFRGTFYTPALAGRIGDLPRDVIDDRLRRGHLVETTPTPAAPPPHTPAPKPAPDAQE